MTEDHIFPRGVMIPGQRKVTQVLHKADPNYRGRQGSSLVQNGLKKSTLCSDCNNRVLGAFLDPALVDFCKAVRVGLEHIRFPVMPSIHIEHVQLNKVVRAVAGHLIASDDLPTCRHRNVRALRRYVLCDTAPFPDLMRAHLWLYPFTGQAILKDLNHARLGQRYAPLWMSAFKTYPLAFAFCSKVEDPAYRIQGVLDVTDALSPEIERNFNVTLLTRPLVQEAWPFAPHQDGVIMTSDRSGNVTTKPYKNVSK